LVPSVDEAMMSLLVPSVDEAMTSVVGHTNTAGVVAVCTSAAPVGSGHHDARGVSSAPSSGTSTKGVPASQKSLVVPWVDEAMIPVPGFQKSLVVPWVDEAMTRVSTHSSIATRPCDMTMPPPA